MYLKREKKKKRKKRLVTDIKFKDRRLWKGSRVHIIYLFPSLIDLLVKEPLKEREISAVINFVLPWCILSLIHREELAIRGGKGRKYTTANTIVQRILFFLFFFFFFFYNYFKTNMTLGHHTNIMWFFIYLACKIICILWSVAWLYNVPIIIIIITYYQGPLAKIISYLISVDFEVSAPMVL